MKRMKRWVLAAVLGAGMFSGVAAWHAQANMAAPQGHSIAGDTFPPPPKASSAQH